MRNIVYTAANGFDAQSPLPVEPILVNYIKPFHIKDFADGKLSIALLKTCPNEIGIHSATNSSETRRPSNLFFAYSGLSRGFLWQQLTVFPNFAFWSFQQRSKYWFFLFLHFCPPNWNTLCHALLRDQTSQQFIFCIQQLFQRFSLAGTHGFPQKSILVLLPLVAKHTLEAWFVSNQSQKASDRWFRLGKAVLIIEIELFHEEHSKAYRVWSFRCVFVGFPLVKHDKRVNSISKSEQCETVYLDGRVNKLDGRAVLFLRFGTYVWISPILPAFGGKVL